MKAFFEGDGPERNRRVVNLPVIPGAEEEVTLDASGAQILLEHWQARCGAIVTVRAADGRFHRARVTALSTGEARLVVFAALPFAPESPLFLEVFQALPQRERFELVLEKLVELGVIRIASFVSTHSITLEERDARQRKSHRWPDVVLRAARQ
ncbi:MAG: 16S rRNA (uracil(1498)-N(3))-methyltransferase [Deltaproteobacteria bacterium]|nr:16S rRNA (uracil(1498)-N(3))-methyltransferase [Deltaproteobacteria bacterium]